jgi:hypothetical protein
VTENHYPDDPGHDAGETDAHWVPRVRIVGDPIRFSDHIRETLASTLRTTEQMGKALAPAITAGEEARKNMSLLLEGIRSDLRLAPPKLDWTGMAPLHYEKLHIDFPKPPPPVVPAHIEEVADAVNKQTAAIVALHGAIEVLADRGDSRHRWVVGLTVALVMLTWVICLLTVGLVLMG